MQRSALALVVSVFVFCLPFVSAQSPPSTTLNFSTYLGAGGTDSLRDVATDAAGNIYAVGGTASPLFPVTMAPAYNAGTCATLGSGGRMDVFVTKVSPAGHLVWSRFLGGPCYDRAYAVEVDTAGNIYVAGRAGSGFPTTSGARQPAFGGDTNPNSLYGQQDGFIVKLGPDGAILWSTYLGGNDSAIIRDLALDASANVYVVQQPVMANQPHVTPGAFQTTRGGAEDIAVTKLTTAGQLVWGTYYGGSAFEGQGASIRVDSVNQPIILAVTASNNLPTKNAYKATRTGGLDFAVAKFTADGSALVYATYLGGSADEGVETHHLEIDAQDNAFVSGVVRSGDFPTTAGAYQRTFGGGMDAGIAKFSPTGQLLASTYFGGAGTDGTQGVDLDAQGNFVFSGATSTTTHNAAGGLQLKLNGSVVDQQVAKLSADLSTLLYFTYFGGSAADEARGVVVTPSGDIVFGGQTASSNFPVKNAIKGTYGGGGLDVTLASLRIDTPTPPPVNCAGTWSGWTPVGICTNSQQAETRSFTVTTPAAHGGTACPSSPETRQVACVIPPPTPTPPPPTPPPPSGAHGYFDMLSKMAGVVRAISFRDPTHLGRRANGGYAHSNSAPLRVVYDPVLDAAKLTISATQSNNNLLNQIRVPIPDHRPHSLLVTWDSRHGKEWDYAIAGIRAQKTWQITCGDGGTDLCVEPRNRFNLGNYLDVRGYLLRGPGTVSAGTVNGRNYGVDSLGPLTGEFKAALETWTRHWVFFSPVSGTSWWEVSYWVADATRDPVQILSRLQVRPPLATAWFDAWWAEFNTSQDVREPRPTKTDLTAAFRNLVIRTRVSYAEIPTLLIKP